MLTRNVNRYRKINDGWQPVLCELASSACWAVVEPLLIYSCSPHHSSDYTFGWTTIGLLLMTMQLAYRKRQGVFLSSKKFQVSSFRALSQWWGGRAAWGSEWPADPNVSLLPLWLRCRPHTSSPFHFSGSVCKMIRCSKRGRRHICEQS